MKDIKITYVEGCFDELAEEMTQEELDALVLEIETLVTSGELFEHSQELSDEENDMIMHQLNDIKKNVRQ